jgi:hypothetical protein
MVMRRRAAILERGVTFGGEASNPHRAGGSRDSTSHGGEARV